MKRRLKSALAVIIVITIALLNSVSVSAADSYKDWTQSDSRWGSKTLGVCGDTMSEIGCAVTSMAILAVHSGSASESTFNPGILCDYLSKNGGFDSYGNVYWGAASGLVPSFTFEKRASFSSNTKTSITKELTNYINQGYYIIMSVNYDCHWIVIDTVKNGVVYMIDPAQNKNDNLFDYYDEAGMLQVRLYKGKNAPSSVDSSTSSTSQYLTGHYVTTDALNFRASYSTSSNVMYTIPKGKTVVVTRVYNNEWGQIEYNNKTGWIFLEYTKYTEDSYSYKTGNYKVNATTGVYMRTGIGTQNTAVTLVPYKGVVNISSVKANWGKAVYNSNVGWICMEYVDYVGETATTTTTTTTKLTTTTTKKTTTTTVKTTTSVKTTSATTTSTTVTTTFPLIKGDINRDGVCDKNDLALLNSYIAKPTKLNFTLEYTLDVNGDNVIDERDSVYLFKLISKGKMT